MWSLMSLASSTNRKRPAQTLAAPPRQVARVDRQAVPADPGPGREAHEAERLGRRPRRSPPRRRCRGRAANIASSLTSAMLTCRNVFSSSLASSADLGRGHRHGVVDDRCGRRRRPRARDPSSMPETTFGVVSQRPHRGCPGRSAPGCSRRWKSRPARQARARPRGAAPAAPRWCPGRSWTPARPWRPARSVRRQHAAPPARCSDRSGAPSSQRRRHGDHRDVEAVAVARVRRWPVAPARPAPRPAARRGCPRRTTRRRRAA